MDGMPRHPAAGAWQRWLLAIAAVVLAACQAVIPTAVPGAVVDLGAAGGPTIEAVLSVQRRWLTQQVTHSQVHHYEIALVQSATPTTVVGQFTASGSDVGSSRTARFTRVPDGTYKLRVNALDSSNNSIVEGGQPVVSSDTATVASPTVTYSAGNALAVSLQLAHSPGATVAVTVTAPAGHTVESTVRSTGYPQASFVATPYTFRYTRLADGIWTLWAMGYSTLTGKAWPVRPSGAVTVAAATGDGPFTVTALGTIQATVGSQPAIGDGGLGTAATLFNSGYAVARNVATTNYAQGSTQPTGVVFDGAGNLVIADRLHHRLRVLAKTTATHYGQAMTANHIYTIAGTGDGGFGGDGVAATATSLNEPTGLARDAAGNLFVCDTFNHRVRMIPVADGTFYGQAMTANRIYTIAGSGTSGSATDNANALTATLNTPTGIAVDSLGNVFIADAGNTVVRMLANTATTPQWGKAMVQGGLYTIAGGGASTANQAVATNYRFPSCHTLAIDSSDNLYVAGYGSSAMTYVAMLPRTDGTRFGVAMTTGGAFNVVGTGTLLAAGSSPGEALCTSAQLCGVAGLAVDATGNLFLAESNLSAGFQLRMVARTAGTYYGRTFAADNNIRSIGGVGGMGALAIDAGGNVAFWTVSNAQNSGYVGLLAASAGTHFGVNLAVNGVGAVAGKSTAPTPSSGAASAANLLNAGAYSKGNSLTYDHQGNLFLCNLRWHWIQMVPAATGTYFGQAMTAGQIHTLVSTSLNQPSALVTASNGDLYFTHGTNRVDRLSRATGARTIVAGGGASTLDGALATAANIAGTQSLAIDRHDNLYIGSGSGLLRVRMVPAVSGSYFGSADTWEAGKIYTVVNAAGNLGTPTEGSLARDSTISGASGLAVDYLGNLYLSESNYVWMVPNVAPNPLAVPGMTTGHYFGKAMQAGRIYRIAGVGTTAFGGDGGSALAASLFNPVSLAISPSGHLYVADVHHGVVRLLSLTGSLFTVAGYCPDGLSSALVGETGSNGSAVATTCRLGYAINGIAVKPDGTLGILGQTRVWEVR